MPRVTITVPDKTPQPYRFQLDRLSVTLGRGSDNDIAIDCGSISVKHAEMLRVEGGYELRDLGSTNGIKLDGTRMHVIPLTNGGEVKLGDVVFDFVLSDEELEILSREAAPAAKSALTPIDDSVGDAASPKIPTQRQVVYVGDSGGGGGLGMIILFIILAAAAFFAGMAVRFQKETGGSMIEAIKARNVPAAPPTQVQPAPVAPAGESK